MSKPKLAMQTDRGRFYRNNNHPDRKFISVTTALKVLDKPALVGWAARTVAEEFMAALPSAVKASRSKTSREAFIKEIKGSPYAKRDKAANRGTEVHEAAEAHILGKPHPVAEEIAPFVAQLLDAIDYLGMTFEASEATVAHPEVGYAGTGDIWARFGKHLDPAWLWQLDIKTGDDSKPIDAAYPEYAFQLSALRHAPELWLPDHTIIDAPKVDRCAVLNLRPSGWALVPVPEKVIEPAFVVFSRCVEIATLQAQLKDELFEPCVQRAEGSPLVIEPAPVAAVPA